VLTNNYSKNVKVIDNHDEPTPLEKS